MEAVTLKYYATPSSRPATVMDKSDKSVIVAEPKGKELKGSRDAKEGATPCTSSDTTKTGAVPVMDLMSLVKLFTSVRSVLKVTSHV